MRESACIFKYMYMYMYVYKCVPVLGNVYIILSNKRTIVLVDGIGLHVLDVRVHTRVQTSRYVDLYAAMPVEELEHMYSLNTAYI